MWCQAELKTRRLSKRTKNRSALRGGRATGAMSRGLIAVRCRPLNGLSHIFEGIGNGEETRRFYIALGFDPCPAEAMALVVTLRDLRAVIEGG